MKRPDPRETPTYSVSEVAGYLGIPIATLRSWVLGRTYATREGEKVFKPVIEIADRKLRQLSFTNLVEAHVLNALRRFHEVPLPKIRSALVFLKRQFDSDHPLADQVLETDKLDLFVQRYGHLINVSQDGQLAIRQLLKDHLERIARDVETGAPSKLYLFTRKYASDDPRAVVIDPEISFGKPVLAGTGIPVSVLAERYKAGETIRELADDYGRSQEEIEEAIRCELKAA